MSYYTMPRFSKINHVGDYTPARNYIGDSVEACFSGREEGNIKAKGVNIEEAISRFHETKQKHDLTHMDLRSVSNEDIRGLYKKNPKKIEAIARYQGVKISNIIKESGGKNEENN